MTGTCLRIHDMNALVASSVMENALLEINGVSSSFKVVTKTGFLSLSIIDLLRQIILSCESYPMYYRCLALSLAYIHDTPVMTTKNYVSRYWQMSPGDWRWGWRESIQLRTTELRQKYNGLIYKISVLRLQKQQAR